MERLEFDCGFDLVEKIETILVDIDDEYPLISVYGKYDVVKTILEYLITDGFHIANGIKLEDYDVSYYDKEFVLYVTEDGVNVEKAYYDNKYLYSIGNVSFVHEDCSSALLKYIESDKVYEFGFNDEDEDNSEDEYSDCDHDYTVNGQKVDKETFNNYVSKFAPDKAKELKDESDNSNYSISVKYNLDAGDALEIIADMERRMEHINDMFSEMNNFRRLFNW